MKGYLKEAFLFRWNLLFFLGGLAGAAIAPLPDVTLPLLFAGELAYLTALTSLPRFRAAIDAKFHAAQGTAPAATTTAPSLVVMLAGLPGDLRRRFEELHGRCVEMRHLAVGVRGASGRDAGSAEEIRTPGLDRLLWLFLRLLMSKNALDRFLQTMSSEEIKTRLEQLKKDLASAQQAVTGGAAGDDRIVRSLQDSVAMAELRLDNYDRAKKNAQFVSIELDRMESKIQALAEMAVNRQDPDLISSQVDSAAESMRQTEKAVSELQHLTGLADELQDPPPILDADLRQVLRHDS
jgi:ribosomal protein L29